MNTTLFAPATDYETMRVRWTRDDCEAFERAGVLTYRYELMDGVILRKMPQNIRHNHLIIDALFWLAGIFTKEYLLSQSSIHVASDEDENYNPEPDVILLNKPKGAITTPQPRPEDVRLLIEIADTTSGYDLGTKARLYARAGVPEYWVAHLDKRVVYVHTNPTPDGEYTRIERCEPDALLPLNAPANAVPLPVADLLPPVEA